MEPLTTSLQTEGERKQPRRFVHVLSPTFLGGLDDVGNIPDTSTYLLDDIV